ncbi:DUF2752 domain-containing protein [Rhodopirellula bahusiensis]|uniref:DUF2752 domain-containing protein n=1 Tax=Rhodopirellula bahusiensis TaxID=2014065 RepID=UPI00326504AA
MRVGVRLVGSVEEGSASLSSGVKAGDLGRQSVPAPVGLSANRCAWWFRLLMITGALVGGGLLGVARSLSPASAGLGTHQQLGLPPCSMRMLFGVRCPACGMTTSWSWLTRGDLVASAQASFTGMLLGLFVLALVVVAVRVAWFGRSSSGKASWWMGFGVVFIGVLSAAEWLVRLQFD